MTPRDCDTWFHLLVHLGVRPAAANVWSDAFAAIIPTSLFGRGTGLADFLGQVLHESARLSRVKENLSYTAQRLTQVWPRRFPTLAAAQPFARNPRALANKVYGGRMGNRRADDGWLYRGRGPIQITGRDNYIATQRDTGLPVLAEPDLLLTPEPGLRAAIAWWGRNVRNSDLGDIEAVTRRVNGGLNGLADRRALTQRAREALE